MRQCTPTIRRLRRKTSHLFVSAFTLTGIYSMCKQFFLSLNFRTACVAILTFFYQADIHGGTDLGIAWNCRSINSLHHIVVTVDKELTIKKCDKARADGACTALCSHRRHDPHNLDPPQWSWKDIYRLVQRGVSAKQTTRATIEWFRLSAEVRLVITRGPQVRLCDSWSIRPGVL